MIIERIEGWVGNTEFQKFSENFLDWMCTTFLKSPWSNGLIERHNAILDLTVTKTIEGNKCDLQLGVSWTVIATTFPNVFDDLLTALESKAICEIVAKNLNKLH